jgi:dCTP deaminase
LPPTITGLIFGKSTYARAGLSLNTTAAEAGWSGHLTLELTNSTPRFLRVYPGRGIAQIHFFKGDSPNAPYKGKYQSQGETPRIYDNGG